MPQKRKKHASLPKGHKLGEVYNGRVWTLHPTKGYRCMSTVTVGMAPKKEKRGFLAWFGALKKINPSTLQTKEI